MYPMRLVRGQGLSQAMATNTPHIQCQQYILQSFTQDPWYTKLVFILMKNKCSKGLTATQRHTLRLKSVNYMIKDLALYRNNYEVIYLRCLDQQEACKMIEEFHGKYGTKHGSTDATAHQTLKEGYYWPRIFKDTNEHARHCHTC